MCDRDRAVDQLSVNVDGVPVLEPPLHGSVYVRRDKLHVREVPRFDGEQSVDGAGTGVTDLGQEEAEVGGKGHTPTTLKRLQVVIGKWHPQLEVVPMEAKHVVDPLPADVVSAWSPLHRFS